MKAIISGYGFVGKSTFITINKFSNKKFDFSINDPLVGEVNDWDAKYHFISVPTNLIQQTQTLDLSIVKAVIAKANANGFRGYHVIRSTISPTDYDEIVRFSNSHGSVNDLISWPEFIREAHWEQDAANPRLTIMAGKHAPELIGYLVLPITYIEDPRAAWLMKLARNAFYASKVTIANDLWHASRSLGIDYDRVKQALQADPYIGSSHWDQPGHDGSQGYGGKCLPKDTASLSTLLNSLGNYDNFARWTDRKNKIIRG